MRDTNSSLRKAWRKAATLISLPSLIALNGALVYTAFPNQADRLIPPEVTDLMFGRQCIDAADLDRKTEFNYNLTTAFTLMAQQRFAGERVATAVLAPENRVRLCKDRTLPLEKDRSTIQGLYLPSMNQIRVPQEADFIRGESTVIHESFHAYQHLNGAFIPLRAAAILPEDRALALLFIEATAYAYTQTVLYEAGKSYSSEFDIFTEAYWKSYGPADRSDRAHRTALQAAGQAVVRHLLAGGNAGWHAAYKQNALALLESRRPSQTDDRLRAALPTFLALAGHVSADLSLTPPEFIGDNANQTLAEIATIFGLPHTPLPHTPPSRPQGNTHPGLT